jgi:hypothetical protein
MPQRVDRIHLKKSKQPYISPPDVTGQLACEVRLVLAKALSLLNQTLTSDMNSWKTLDP